MLWVLTVDTNFRWPLNRRRATLQGVGPHIASWTAFVACHGNHRIVFYIEIFSLSFLFYSSRSSSATFPCLSNDFCDVYRQKITDTDWLFLNFKLLNFYFQKVAAEEWQEREGERLLQWGLSLCTWVAPSTRWATRRFFPPFILNVETQSMNWSNDQLKRKKYMYHARVPGRIINGLK